MDAFVEMLMSRMEHLLQRVGGPLNFRLLIMPLVVTYLAIRAGMRDAREGHPPFIWTILASPVERRGLVLSALKDVGKIFVVAVVLDTTYQLVVLRALYVGEVLFIAVACAIVPYVVIRGPVSLLMRRVYRRHPRSAGPSAANSENESEDRPVSKPSTDH